MIDFELTSGKPISNGFLASGISTFQEAASYVRDLPHRRTSNNAERLLVLVEGRGTCRTKHALLVELAREQNHSIDLALSFFRVNSETMPSTSEILM